MLNETVCSGQRVLVVDDHGISRRFTVAALRHCGCAVKPAEGVSESIKVACTWLPEVIFTDWRLADGYGEDVVRGVREKWPRGRALPRFVLITGESPCAPEIETARTVFERVLFKPCTAAALVNEARPVHPCGVQEAHNGSASKIRQLFGLELERRLPELDALIANGQAMAAAAISHQLIASSAMCGEEKLAAAFRSLDSACRKNAGAETLAHRWSKLSAMARDYLAGV